MTNNLSNIDFTTYYLGFPDDIQKSSRIRLFFKENINLSLSNLDEINNNILSDSTYNESGFNDVYLRDEDQSFKINCLGGEKFNSIIYYSDILKTPVGFTIFSQLQEINIDENSKINKIQIFTNFEEIVNSNYIIQGRHLFINTLSSLIRLSEEDTNSSRKFLSDPELPYNYSSLEDITEYLLEENTRAGINYLRYSNSITDFFNDPSYAINTDCLTTINSVNPEFYCFSLLNGVEVDTYNTKYTKFFISLYKDNLALYEFSEDEESFGAFRVLSLTEKNKFGLPKILIEKNYLLEYTKDSEVISMSNGFIVFRNIFKNIWYIADLLTPHEVIKVPLEFGILMDPWERNFKITYFSKNKVLNTIFDLFPKNSEAYKKLFALPINESLLSTIIFEKKIGEWFVFKTTGNTSKTAVIYSSKFGSIYFDESEENYIIPVTDRILLVQTKDVDLLEYKFTFYFSRSGSPVYSDEYSKLNGFGQEINNKISFNSSINSTNPEEVIKRKLLLDGLRRAPIYSYSFPKERCFISSFRGLMFYIETDSSGIKKLYYL